MKFEDILKKEKERTEEDLYTVYLYLEGIFWRAQNESAFILINTDAGKSLKVSKLKDNKGNITMKVGFPQKSFEKFTDGCSDFSSISENECVVKFDTLSFVLTLDDLKEKYRKWVDETELTKTKEKSNKINSQQIKNKEVNDVNELIREIVSFDINNHTMIEQVLFLNNIRQQCIKFL